MLGAETGSASLRDWARRELNGYGDDDVAPEYRRFSNVPMSMDSISGNTWATGQVVTRFQVPGQVREYLPEELILRQPVESLEAMMGQDSVSFTTPAMGYAMNLWNRQLGPYQSVVNLSYRVSGTNLAGVIGQIRTKLVDVVADLTASTPLEELPSKTSVDDAFRARVTGSTNTYTTTINNPSGPTAIGEGAQASSGSSLAEVLELLEQASAEAGSAPPDLAEDVVAAVRELREALLQKHPQGAEVLSRAGKLRALAERAGVGALSTSVGGVVGAVTEMALAGAFG